MFLPDISAVRSQGLDYVLGETNSYACHGAPGVSNVAGAALWALDYALFAKSGLGATRVFFHEGVGYKYNLILILNLLDELEKRLVAEAPTLLALISVFKLDIHCRSRMISIKRVNI
ncbi:hypothetical protein K435DRAFT_879050 [Dendrothele bispora CBS 962.96]|uniref:Uncharacterized protein n=1 Tax=Dendrothele bispora (strain CBS 962.96) TaxID=1314807 RepID=A0A4S8KLS7_DENBC|nr:hypothetical protein K435DRAFT_879050 [Dendrothele bispora CBS 962.96]